MRNLFRLCDGQCNATPHQVIKITKKTKVNAQNKHIRAYVVVKYSFKNNNCIG